MKSPFKKLRDLAIGKHSKLNESSSFAPEEESEDVTQGIQDLDDMRSQFEGLLTNAHTISGAAYDFSRSVQDMASYMIETFGEIIDGDIGNVFSMLAKVQFEITKFLDLFAAHVSQTIITPTEMMMGDLQQVQAMKEEYDEKRQAFNLAQKDMQKQKPRNGKTENLNQLVSEKEELKEKGRILSVQLQSLKQGRSRSLITQAVRYHSAQMHLFNKGLTSITAMEPVMRQLATEKNINRSLPEVDTGNNVYLHDMHEEHDASKNGAESGSLTSSPTTSMEPEIDAAEMLDVDMVSRKVDPSSKSAPISSSTYYQREAPSHTQEKVSMYALPSPSNANVGLTTQMTGHEVDSFKPSSGDSKAARGAKKLLFLERPIDDARAHCTPAELNTKQHKKDEKLITFNELTNDGNSNNTPKIGRSYSHSGPITNKRFLASNKHQNNNNSSSTSTHDKQVDPLYKSGPVSKSPMPAHIFHSSQNVSPPLVSPPQISELHKLPLPPPPNNSASLIAHSAPLGKKAQEPPQPKSGPTSPLPPPPGLVVRSLSIPASSSHLSKSEQESTNDTQHGFPSPPLKPLTLPATTNMI